MKNQIKAKNWHKKYGVKQFNELTKGTMTYYKWCSKIGRREYMTHSRKKYNRFSKKNPSDLKFRVLKAMVLRHKNVSPQLMIQFKKLVQKTNTTRGFIKHKSLPPKALYIKMKTIYTLKTK